MTECHWIGCLKKWFYRLFGVAALACVAFTPVLQAKDFTAMEGQLRAAVTVGVLRFTSWQNLSKAGAIDLCLLGKPISEPFLLPVDGEAHIGHKTLNVRKAKASSRAWQGCHALVMGERLSAAQSSAALAYAADAHVLTVCDGCAKEVASGVMIKLRLEEKRVRFEVNLAKANAAKVHLDASLLELATKVSK